MSNRFSSGSQPHVDTQVDPVAVIGAMRSSPAPLTAHQEGFRTLLAAPVIDTAWHGAVPGASATGGPVATPRSSPPLESGSIAASRHEAHTDQVPVHQRSSYWLDLMCSTLVSVDHESAPGTPFTGRVSSLRLGCLTVGHIRTNAVRMRRTPERIRRDPDSYYLIQI